MLQDGKENQENSYLQFQTCKNFLSTSDEEERKKIILDYPYLETYPEICEAYASYDAPPDSAYNTFSEFLYEENYLFPFFIPIIVLFPFMYIIARELKSKMVKNYCLRKSYKEYIGHIFKTAYKNIYIIPCVILITFLISYIISGGNLNPSTDIGLHYALPNLTFINNPIFPILYLITLVLGMGLYINIGLIVLSRNKNFVVSLLESELAIFLVWCFCSIFCGAGAKSIFGINPDNFNLLSLYDWSNVDNMYLYFIVNLIMFLITLILALYAYKDKEKIICMCEK